MIEYCGNDLNNRSKYKESSKKKCHLQKGHLGKCEEYPFLSHLNKFHKRISDKIKRDSSMTTGAAWKSEDAGPNRILRWLMLLPDEDLIHYGINMNALKPGVISKLRDKSATYEDCIQVAIKLTWYTYNMPNAPKMPPDVSLYIGEHFGTIESITTCKICLLPLSFSLFDDAQRGKAVIETCHLDPRQHNSKNVGFAHRECNIAQGNKTLSEFYEWISGIIFRANS